MLRWAISPNTTHLSAKMRQNKYRRDTSDATTSSSLIISMFMMSFDDSLPSTRPDTRHKMRLVRVRFTFEKKHGTDRRTNGWTDTTSYRDATAQLKTLFENNTGQTNLQMDGQTDGRTDGRTCHISWRYVVLSRNTNARNTSFHYLGLIGMRPFCWFCLEFPAMLCCFFGD